MSSRRKIAAFLLYLLLIALVTFITSTAVRSRPVGSATFKGWTNLAGKLHAIIEFPPVTASEPAKNFFVRWFYCAQFNYAYTDPSGARTNGSAWIPLYQSPTQFTTVHLEVPHNITHLQITRAATSIERRWDNIDFPFRRHNSLFHFRPPAIDSPPPQP